MKIGIVGKIASGKSTAAQWFVKKRGFFRIDLDMVGHEIMNNSSYVRHLLKDKLPEIFTNDIFLERSQIADIVFKDKKKLKVLNSILHPEMKMQVYQTIKDNNDRNIVIDGALLYEMELDKLCDRVIFVTVPFNRAQKRSSRDFEDFRRIWEYQEFIDSGQKQSHLVIENSSSLEKLHKKLEKYSKEILNVKQQSEG